MKRLPFPKLSLFDKKEFTILDFGTYNEFESGPDFQEASILYDDLKWFGSIEIHINASDWYKHKHHSDKAYNNVILHVVYNNDKEVVQNGRIIPTIELKTHIDSKHYEKFNQLNAMSFDIPCTNSILEIPRIYQTNMKDRAIETRLKRKLLELQKIHFLDDQHLLFILFARSFGSSVNQQPFESLAISFDIQQFLALPKGLRTKSLEQYAGFINNKDCNFFESQFYQWRFKGLRPNSFPKKRIQLFSEFVSEFDFNFPFWDITTIDLIDFFSSQNVLSNNKSILQNILVNAIPLFLYRKAHLENEVSYINQAIELLKYLPTESNYITRKWSVIGIVPKNAFDSQAHLEIYKQFCTRKRCLNCSIGIKLLNK
jgi:hypothetical protein